MCVLLHMKYEQAKHIKITIDYIYHTSTQIIPKLSEYNKYMQCLMRDTFTTYF